MRLFRVREYDVLGMLVYMLHSKSDEWTSRACRLVGAWVSGNVKIQNLMLENGIIPLLVECLRSQTTIQKLHAGMTLMHISYQNRLTRSYN